MAVLPHRYLFVLCRFSMSMVLLNCLIAIMADACTRVSSPPWCLSGMPDSACTVAFTCDLQHAALFPTPQADKGGVNNCLVYKMPKTLNVPTGEREPGCAVHGRAGRDYR